MSNVDVAIKEGYRHVKVLANGEVAGIYKFAFTTAIVVGINRIGYRTRFCFEHEQEAIESLHGWNGEGWPPGYWIKKKGETEEHGPGSPFYKPKETTT